MNLGIPQRATQPRSAVIAVMFFLLLPAGALGAQRGQRGAAAGPPRPAREAAPIDLTGYWVSVVSEDWRVRMVVAQKGDWQFMPLNAEGNKVALANNPAAEDPCKAYGAAGIMRIPTRLHITWDNDSTLHIDTDAGKQTRLFHFGQTAAPTGAPTLQGYSVAQWEARAPNSEVGGKQSPGGELKVVTSRMAPGYYFKHGVPYSGNAVLTEYFARIAEGPIDYLLVSTVVEDPQYLTQPFAKTLVFRREPNGAKWNPAACSVP